MRRFARLGALVASASLAVTGLAAVAPPAQAVPEPDPLGTSTGVSWLKAQLTNGVVHNNQFDFDDYGLTVDVAFALDAVGGEMSTVQSISSQMADDIDAYTKFGNHVYAGSLAKQALLADIAGDPTSYGGRNLVTELNARISTTSPIEGRMEDAGFTSNPFDGDIVNTVGQAYAVRVLSAAGASRAPSARAFLLQQQCDNGGFRLNFTASKAAGSDQSCTDNAQAQLDATSVALLQLKALGSSDAPVTTAIANATTFLNGQQQPSGAWGGDPGGSPANANSTGLAAWALGDTARSEDAATWLRGRQATYYDTCTKLNMQIGAVAYDPAALSTGRTGGITVSNQDQFRRATAQAVPALEYLDTEITSLTPVLTGPSGFLKAGRSYTFQVTGVPVGDELCLTATNARSGSTVASTPWTRALYMSNVPGVNRTVAVRDRNNNLDTTTVKVLSSKGLGIERGRYRHKRRTQITVAVVGLAPGERASVYYKGALKGQGIASAAGRFTDTFSVGRATGRKPISAFGQFGDIRNGKRFIKVVR